MNHAAKESFLTCFQLVAEYMSTERKIVLYIYNRIYIYITIHFMTQSAVLTLCDLDFIATVDSRPVKMMKAVPQKAKEN